MTVPPPPPPTSTLPPSTTEPRGRASGWAVAIGLPLAVALLLALLVTAFAWPAVNSAPHGVPLAVVAPAPLAHQVEERLAASAGQGAFEVTVLPDRAAAERAVRGREVYGALLLPGPGGQPGQGGEALVASAASPPLAQMLTQLAGGIPPEAGGPLPVTDLVPLPAGDPHGVGLAVGLLPLVVGGFALGVVTALRVEGTARRIVAIVLGCLLGGLVVVGLLQGWLGALDGPFWTTCAAAALVILAVAATAAGLHRLLGPAGLALAALVVVVLGTPLSGVGSAPEMLPAGWGTLGQWLPPGAAATAVRSVAFFDGARSGGALLVLTGWALLGLVLLLLGRREPRATAG